MSQATQGTAASRRAARSVAGWLLALIALLGVSRAAAQPADEPAEPTPEDAALAAAEEAAAESDRKATEAKAAADRAAAAAARLEQRFEDQNSITLGASGYRGSYKEQSKTLAGVNPLRVLSEDQVVYDEYALGADVSTDIGALRFRAEPVICTRP